MTMIPAIEIAPGVYMHTTCIRLDDTVNKLPRIHHNSSHVTAGIDGIEVAASGALAVHLEKQSDGGKRAILSGIVGPDETFAPSGWVCGFSGGVGVANLVFSKGGVRYSCRHPNLYRSGNNLWLTFFTRTRE